jgi:LPS-assembly protein
VVVPVYVYGTGASFWVKNVPLIPFVPFFAAAIRRERQTGFLFPTFGSSSRKGFYADIPFFWAISDSQDLTVAFNAFSQKGFGGRALYRYRISEDHGGSIGGFYVNEVLDTKDDRGWGNVRHEWRGAPGWRAVADVNIVSDDDVLRDYSTRLSDRSLQRVDTNVFVTRSFQHWNLVGSLFSYQDLTTERGTELRRLPEIRADRIRTAIPWLPGVLFDFESSATYFQRDVGTEGARIDLHPRLSRPFRPGGLFTVTPFVGGRITAYDKTAVGRRLSGGTVEIDEIENDARVRRYVTAGGDIEMPLSRVYAFERWGVDALLHRIEPRVNYTYIGGEDMNKLPLYTERIDRIKDASLVTYSLTNRILARTASSPDAEPVRWEALRFLLGHSIDLRSENHTIGDIVFDLILQAPSIFRFRGEMRYEMARKDVSTAITDFSIVLPRVTAAIGTRYDAEQRTNFLQGTVRGEITRILAAHASTNWDTRTDTFVENRFGVDLRFQCYEFSLVYIDRARETGRRSGEEEFRFSLNLLGVGGPLRTSVGP